MLNVTSDLKIPSHEFEFSVARSSGPGGQNVNKVNSKVLLHWNIKNSVSISDAVRTRFINRFGNRITKTGFVMISSDRHRDQLKNREDCLAKLSAMLREVALPPKPRKKSRPSKGSVQRLKTSKQRHSGKKQSRGRVRAEHHD